MSQTHWKKLQNPDYLGAYAFDPGQELIVTIKSVRQELVTGADGKREQCSVMRFVEDVKPMILNATNSKTIQKLFKTPYIEEWAGRKIQLYVTEVSAFGEKVDAVRVRPFPPEEETYDCVDCGARLTDAFGLTARQIAGRNQKNYGRVLCPECAKKMKAAAEAAKKEGDVLSEDHEDQDS